jgi:hypothetical protein
LGWTRARTHGRKYRRGGAGTEMGLGGPTLAVGDPARMQVSRAPPICSSLGAAARVATRSCQDVSSAGIVGRGVRARSP